MNKPNYIILERYDKSGKLLFTMPKPKPQADILLKNHGNYPSGEKNWVLAPKKKKDENSKK